MAEQIEENVIINNKAIPGIPEIKSYSLSTFPFSSKNVANWKIDSKRAVLLIHDMQKFFVRKIPFKGLREDLLRNTKLLRERCINQGIPTAYTCQNGNMTESQRGLLKSFWGPGMKAAPADREIVDELLPSQENWLFTKWRYSAFYKSDLLQRMRNAGRDQLIICGVYAHIGVLATAMEAFSNDIETFLISDAVADFSQEHHLMALNYAASCCAVVMPVSRVLV